MSKRLIKDFFREIGKTMNRFLSIFFIVLLGVAFFSGIKATAPDMAYTADKYYDAYNMMDVQVMSTLGLTEEDIEAIEDIEGVQQVQAGYFTDAVSVLNSSEFVFRIHSLPKGYLDDPEGSYINKIQLVEGRLPEKPGECVIEDSNTVDSGLKIGDKLTVSSGNTTDILDGVLKTNTFTVVGKAITPYYLMYDKGASTVGSGSVNFFMMISEEDFAFPVYTEALLRVEGAGELNTFSDPYADKVERVMTQLDNLGADRSTLRVDELKAMAEVELDKARKQLASEQKNFDEQIADGQKQLDEALVKLSEGEALLTANKENFEKEYANGQQQLESGKKDLEKAHADLEKGEADYAEGLASFNEQLAKHEQDIQQLDKLTKVVNANQQAAIDEIHRIDQELQNPSLSDEDRLRLISLKGMYQTLLLLTEDAVGSVNDLDAFANGVVEGIRQSLAEARSQLDQGWNEYYAGMDKLAAGEQALIDGKNTAEAEFAKAEADLEQGRKDYESGKIDFENQRADGERKLQEARDQIIRAENEIEKISEPMWYVLDRNANVSYVNYRMTTERIDAIAKIFPVFFFLVAAMVCLTTMTRMVDEQRGLIGTYKALGYSNTANAFKYVAYAGIASLLGGGIGLALGMTFFPPAIFNSWSLMYRMPPLSTVPQVPLAVFSVLIGVAVTVFAAYAACKKELRSTPALLMRPKAPKQGKKIFLERIQWFWKRLSFSQKVTVRNIFRYKKRFWMTVLGIAGCSALLLAGLGLSNSIGQVVNKQYREIFSYHMNLRFTVTSDSAERGEVIEKLKNDADVESFLPVSQINCTVGEDAHSTKLIVPSNPEEFKKYITLRERTSQEPLELPDSGIIITEKLASQMGVSVGDAIKVTNADGITKKVEVKGITENYVFHYAYMSDAAYKEVFRLSTPMDSLLLRLVNTSRELESELSSELIQSGCVASAECYTEAAESFEEQIRSMDAIVMIIILFAGLLAFVVLYNLTNINISERLREIATIKVLGFYNREVSTYIYRENLVLTLVGSLVGLGMGTALHRFIMFSIEQDGIMFGYYIQPVSFLYAALITMLFAFVVCVFMYRRLTGISMVESLKSVE